MPRAARRARVCPPGPGPSAEVGPVHPARPFRGHPARAVAGHPVELPPVTTAYGTWAARLEAHT
ncbi:hypothetical protein, partial [Streptomyces sp. NPDC052693]|uniref:hypothetical protein n=1 Tax=Streptomyces sp. NPDC052693 TaxID=3155814 RepID=UPI00342C7782